MNVHILEMPLDFGASRHGSDMGPSAIRLAGIKEKLESIGHKTYVHTDIFKATAQEYEKPGNPKAKYLKPIVKACNKLASEVEQISSDGDFPLVLGGDHSIVLGSLAGLAATAKKQNQTLGVLYVDAHGDFNTTETTPSGNIHGECLAASAGLGLPELTNLYFEGRKVDPKNICYVGCRDLDPINVFKNRLGREPIILCKNEKSSHICYKNDNYELAVKNGVLCKMENIILDPSKWQENGYTYKGPVDQNTRGEPLLLKGFFNMECNKNNLFYDYDKIYIRYFNSWNYQFNSKISDDIEELAQGKTIFFMGRNQDSPNLFHGISEFINAFSLMILLNKEPKDIQIIFLESILLERVNDPLYYLYKNIISGGNEPIHIRNLTNKKYHISNGYFVPINWDSPCFLSTSISFCKYPSKAYYLLNKYVDKYLNLSEFIDSSTDNKTFYYPKKFDKSKQYKKYVTIQWRRVWPQGRKGQDRIMGNAPELAERLASELPDDILVRLVDTASLPIEEQISIMRKTDYNKSRNKLANLFYNEKKLSL